jgi:transcriptional/translational regulatory protein YebC/TACO1
VFTVYTEPADCTAVAEALEKAGYTFESAQVEMVPNDYIQLTDEKDIQNMEKMLDLLEEDEDVQNVWHNWDQD